MKDLKQKQSRPSNNSSQRSTHFMDRHLLQTKNYQKMLINPNKSSKLLNPHKLEARLNTKSSVLIQREISNARGGSTSFMHLERHYMTDGPDATFLSAPINLLSILTLTK